MFLQEQHLIVSTTLVHTYCFIFSYFSGSANQSIKVLNMDGEVLSNIRYHDGFIGQRIGPLSCLAFHPYWVSFVPQVLQ